MSDETRAELLPCPFCGSAQVTIYEGITGPGRRYTQVECMDCEAQGPREYGAIRRWNMRAERTRCAAIARAHGAEDVAAEIEQPN